MAVDDEHVFSGFLTPVLPHLSFKAPTTFTSVVRGENMSEKKERLNRVSTSQPPDHESKTLITESPGRAGFRLTFLVLIIQRMTCVTGQQCRQVYRKVRLPVHW